MIRRAKFADEFAIHDVGHVVDREAILLALSLTKPMMESRRMASFIRPPPHVAYTTVNVECEAIIRCNHHVGFVGLLVWLRPDGIASVADPDRWTAFVTSTIVIPTDEEVWNN
jgi:hypothetical protein